MNICFSSAKVAIIAKDENILSVASKAAEVLKKNGSEVFLEDSLNDYASYYNMKENEPNLTIFLESAKGKKSKILPIKVENESGTESRNIDESQNAKEFFIHFMRMKGEMPAYLGSYKLNWKDVKYFDWFIDDESAMIYIKTDLSEDDVVYVIENGVKEYFKSKLGIK